MNRYRPMVTAQNEWYYAGVNKNFRCVQLRIQQYMKLSLPDSFYILFFLLLI